MDFTIIRFLESFFDLIISGTLELFKDWTIELDASTAKWFALNWFLVSLVWTLGGDMFLA
jgi:hypothetical protein